MRKKRTRVDPEKWRAVDDALKSYERQCKGCKRIVIPLNWKHLERLLGKVRKYAEKKNLRDEREIRPENNRWLLIKQDAKR